MNINKMNTNTDKNTIMTTTRRTVRLGEKPPNITLPTNYVFLCPMCVFAYPIPYILVAGKMPIAALVTF
jgi:hypothetical protein